MTVSLKQQPKIISIQTEPGKWYRLDSPEITECCSCSAIHITEYKIWKGRLLFNPVTKVFAANLVALINSSSYATLPTCSAGTNAGVSATVNNGVASPTYFGAVGTTGSSTDPVWCTGSGWVYH